MLSLVTEEGKIYDKVEDFKNLNYPQILYIIEVRDRQGIVWYIESLLLGKSEDDNYIVESYFGNSRKSDIYSSRRILKEESNWGMEEYLYDLSMMKLMLSSEVGVSVHKI